MIDTRTQYGRAVGEQRKSQVTEEIMTRFEPSEGSVCNGERGLFDTMIITVSRLDDIRRKVNNLSAQLFGPEPCEDADDCQISERNLNSLATDAFRTSAGIERVLDEIYRRLNETH